MCMNQINKKKIRKFNLLAMQELIFDDLIHQYVTVQMILKPF